MKRLVGVVLLISALTLVLAVPAAATKPTEVSGRWTYARNIGPPQIESRGGNCLVTKKMGQEWGDGQPA